MMKTMKWIGVMGILLLFASCKKGDENGNKNGAWIQKSDLPAKNRSRAIGFAINGIGYAGLGMAQSSGQSGQVEYLNDLWSYNPATDQWTQKASFPGTSRMGAVVFVVNGKAYVGGGSGNHGAVNDFYEYDPVADEWNLSIGMDDFRYSAVAFVVGEKGYVGLGAYYDRQNNFITHNDIWSYAPDLYEWTKLNDFPGESRLGASVFVIGRKAYITAGYSADSYPSTYYNDTYEYDVDNNLWSRKKDLPSTECRNASSFSVGKCGYVAFVNGNELWQYNPDTDKWTQKTRYPGGYAAGSACFVIDNKAYIVSDGGNKKPDTNELWVYDTSKE